MYYTKSIYMNNFQVFEEELVKTNDPFPCMLKLEWRGGEEQTKRLRQKFFLEGSKGRYSFGHLCQVKLYLYVSNLTAWLHVSIFVI